MQISLPPRIYYFIIIIKNIFRELFGFIKKEWKNHIEISGIFMYSITMIQTGNVLPVW